MDSTIAFPARPNTTKAKHSFYMPNLDTLRGVAALMVVVSHVAQRYPPIAGYLELHLVGRIGVSIFFTLSGFLITYLLLHEKESANIVNVNKFYLRRILRIWPLYFCLLIFVYVFIRFFPQITILSDKQLKFQSIALNVFFLTNITFVLKLTPFIITPIWSIGIEEQFYLFWPWIVKRIKVNAINLILFVIFIMPTCRLIANVGGRVFHSEVLKTISKIFATTKFDQMAFGGLIAYLGFYSSISFRGFNIKKEAIEGKRIQLISIIGFLISSVLIMLHFNPEILLYAVSFFMGIIIFNLALNPSTIINIQNKTGDYLGKISFGIYLLHSPVIFVMYYFIHTFLQVKSGFAEQLLSYSTVIVATIAVAAISYKFVESPFLKIKTRLSAQNKLYGKSNN